MLLCRLDKSGNWDSKRLRGLFKVKQQKWTRNHAFFQASVPLILSGHVYVFKFKRNSWQFYFQILRGKVGKVKVWDCLLVFSSFSAHLSSLSGIPEVGSLVLHFPESFASIILLFNGFHPWKKFAGLGKEEEQQSSYFISHLLQLPVPSFTPSEEELKSLLMKVKEESEKVGLKSIFRKRRSWHLVPSLHGK